MELKKLKFDKIYEIYNTHLIFDFPEDEVKPLSRIKAMYEDDYYFAYGLFDKDELLGYAYFVEADDAVLLDYYAVVEEKRNFGYGSIFLNVLKTELSYYKTIILESEYTDAARNEEEKEIRTRRISFYKRNGMIETNIQTILFGVHYSIFTSNEMSDEEVRATLALIYNKMFAPKFLNEFKII